MIEYKQQFIKKKLLVILNEIIRRFGLDDESFFILQSKAPD